jgi:hypothetical protein
MTDLNVFYDEFADAWYWEDDESEEPMGPFESEFDAREDYRALRGHE